jgi:hypothetical protein
MNQPYVPIKDNEKFISILNEEIKKKTNEKRYRSKLYKYTNLLSISI